MGIVSRDGTQCPWAINNSRARACCKFLTTIPMTLARECMAVMSVLTVHYKAWKFYVIIWVSLPCSYAYSLVHCVPGYIWIGFDIR